MFAGAGLLPGAAKQSPHTCIKRMPEDAGRRGWAHSESQAGWPEVLMRGNKIKQNVKVEWGRNTAS